jgi:hypothetical protein
MGDEGAKLEKDIKEQLVNAIKSLKERIDAKFYGIESLFVEEVPKETPKEAAPLEEKK